MIHPEADYQSPARRSRDEQIAAESKIAPVDLPPDASPQPLESHLSSLRKPSAVAGVVENGLIRPLDPNVKLLEHSRVIIVASESI